jgi:uncharacterized membrane protein YhiD involved in acid resistance
MEQLTRFLEQVNAQRLDVSLESTLLALALAFVLGQLVAWVYVRTHSGLSYARSFTQSLVLLTMIAALVIFVIGDSIVTAFGLIGALAIVRFRNVLKDTRDTVFVFTALVLGMAVGSQRYLAALIGGPAVLAAAVLLRATAFGARRSFDGHLTCSLDRSTADRAGLAAVLRRFCRQAQEVSVRSGPEASELVYEVRLRDRRRQEELVDELRRVGGVGQVALLLREELLEP